MQIKHTSALVTGGASGLGEATVRHLHARGAKVVIADLATDAGEALARELGQGAQFAATDVADEEAVARAVGLATEKHGGLHILVNCAGIGGAKRILGRDGVIHDLEHYSRIIRVNLIGTFNCLRLAAAAMVKGEPDAEGARGVVVNTASIAAYEGQIGQIAYASSKGGILGLTLPAARELAQHGIRVVTIAPGIFDTAMLAKLPDKVRQSLGEQVPYPARLGLPAEYASLVGSIVEQNMLNGVTIRLDGALRMASR